MRYHSKNNFLRLRLILINSIGAPNIWESMTDRFHLNQILHSTSFTILHFYRLPCISPLLTDKLDFWTSNIESYLEIWVGRARCVVLSWVWGITYLLDATRLGQSARNLFDVGAQLAIMRIETSAPAYSHKMQEQETFKLSKIYVFFEKVLMAFDPPSVA